MSMTRRRHPEQVLLSRTRSRLGTSRGRLSGFSFGLGVIESGSGRAAPGPATRRRSGASRRSREHYRSYSLAAVEILTSRVLLRPTDLERSLRFYEHPIGLAIYREWGTGPERGVVFFLGGGLLEISGTNPEPPSPAISLVLQVRDVHATHQRLTKQGVAIDAEPERKPWGLIEMTARDPDGLALIIVEIPAEHPRRRG
jgi:predicted enzyme related to lactoylglutathione lyase